jgi:uncharacterized protein (TIGR00661 family)
VSNRLFVVEVFLDMFYPFDLSKYSSQLPKNGRVLVAPLHWGIGHATRCIPIIKQLQGNGFQPIIASDGDALQLLQKVFPTVENIELPSYEINYARKSFWFKTKLLFQLPKFIKTYYVERRIVNNLVVSNTIDAIISDNRFGVFHKEIPSIYITHQLQVKSGLFTLFTTKIHQRIIQNFDACWIPDVLGTPNLSGSLSHRVSLPVPVYYIGILSQLKKQHIPIKYDILVLLSGPEPQREILEKKLLNELKNLTKRICFVRGIIESNIEKKLDNTITIYNYLLGDKLEKVINESELIIARSGYSTVMDLALLQKKAFFIPTSGQLEQIYIAKHLEKQHIAPYVNQNNFKIELLDLINNYSGF